MKFLEILKNKINTIPDLPIQMKIGYLEQDESLVLYTLPGSTVSKEYYDGTKELVVNIEIAMKSKDGATAEKALWEITNFLENLDDVSSEDDDFDFDKIVVTSRPFVNAMHEQGWLVFLLNAKAFVTQYQKEK